MESAIPIMSDNVQTEVSGDRVRVLRTRDDIETIRPLWERMQNHPSAHIDLYLERLRTDPTIVGPCVILVERDGTPRLLAIGRIIENLMKFKIGYFPVYRTRGRILSIIDRGILGEYTSQDAKRLVETIIDLLRQEIADMAHIACLPVESEVYRWALALPMRRCRSHFLQPEKRWILRMPGSYSEFLAQLSSKTRNLNKRSQRKLEDAFGARLAVGCIERPEDLEAALEQVEMVAAKTYQRKLGTGFMNTPQERSLLAWMAQRGMLSIDLMTIEGQPVAFCYGYHYGQVYIYETPGYDARYSQYRVGNYLLLKVIERLCERGTVRTIDFGLGDAQYKQVYSNHFVMESHVRIFAPTWKGLWINIALSLTFFVNGVLKRLLKKTNLYGRIKNYIRHRMRKTGERP